MIRVVLCAIYVFAAAVVMALLGLGDWDPRAQFGVTAAMIVSATWFLPGYFNRGDPLPVRRRRREGGPLHA